MIGRIEKSYLKKEWDSKAARVLKEISYFFSKWKFLKNINTQTSVLYWVQNWNNVKPFVLSEILADPLSIVSDNYSHFPKAFQKNYQWWCLEKSFRPGVTDNTGHVLSEAIELVTRTHVECRSGERLWLELPAQVTKAEIQEYAEHVFFNSLIEQAKVFTLEEAQHYDREFFNQPKWITVHTHSDGSQIEIFNFSKLSLEQLEKLSNEHLWAFSREELNVIQEHFQNRHITDVEIEVLAQTWSEHCKHKIFAADIEVLNERNDIELPKKISSIFKTYIQGATRLIKVPYLQSVFEDNAGIISINEDYDCAIKVETHNSPSALDPYGGALTGIVGVNRDILGAGLGSSPIANLDVFCVGPLDVKEPLPPRLHHPRRILEGVRLGVEHGGNKSGIPTVTGAVVHHEGFLGKPLIFCGTVGLLPRDKKKDLIHKKILPGDNVVMLGGRIGKDGIHGATFSSLELNEASPVSAVQLGDPLTQKRVWDFLIEARDLGLYRAVTDNGAGGLSSSVGELARLCGHKGGATIDVSKTQVKYPGLKPYELIVSESQERMTFAVPSEKLKDFQDLADRRRVEYSVLGEFEDTGYFHILFAGKTVGRLEMKFLHEGVPVMKLKARVKKPYARVLQNQGESLYELLLKTLSHPNVCSRQALVSQFDHEVQARTVRKPYGSPRQASPGDGAALRISRQNYEGIAIGLGLAPHLAEFDPKQAAEMAVDEALRNAVVAGMDPEHAAFIDNFCWPDPLPGPTNPDAELKLGALVLTAKTIYDAAIALKIPFISGKDSMKNDYRVGDIKISVPPTLLITTLGKIHDIRKIPWGYIPEKLCYEEAQILWVSGLTQGHGLTPGQSNLDFNRLRMFYKKIHELICEGIIVAAHDVSDGGWLVATAEMLLGTNVSAHIDLRTFQISHEQWFLEPAASFVFCATAKNENAIKEKLSRFSVWTVGEIKSPKTEPELFVQTQGESSCWKISDLEHAYRVLQ